MKESVENKVIKDALNFYLKECERFMRKRLYIFNKHYSEHLYSSNTKLKNMDISIFNWSVDRVQIVRKLLQKYENEEKI